MKKQKKLAFLFFFFWVVFLILSILESTGYFLDYNIRVENLMIFFRYKTFVDFFKVITFLGNWQFIFPLTLIICLLLWKYKKFKYLLPFLISVFGSHFCSSLLKIIMEKQRPLLPLVTETSFSFPSSHAVVSIVFYGLIVYFFLKYFKSKLSKIIIFVFGAGLIFLIDFSRIYLTAHYFNDVFAGFVFGLMWLIFGILWLKDPGFKKTFLFSLIGLFIVTFLVFLFLPTPPVYSPLKTVVATNAIEAFKKENLPKYTEKPRGAVQHPLSFFIVAKNDQELINVFNERGWVLTDKLTPETIQRLVVAVLNNHPYPKGPITPSLWNKNTQDLSFAKPTEENTIKIRHHCRFWKTNIKTQKGETLYVGSATFDYDMKPWLITHKVMPEIDQERDYLFNDLLKTGQVQSSEKINWVNPFSGRNFQGDNFYTDGKAYVITLGNSK
jgi:membrane-associated phospholipid phosphatase